MSLHTCASLKQQCGDSPLLPGRPRRQMTGPSERQADTSRAGAHGFHCPCGIHSDPDTDPILLWQRLHPLCALPASHTSCPLVTPVSWTNPLQHQQWIPGDMQLSCQAHSLDRLFQHCIYIYKCTQTRALSTVSSCAGGQTAALGMRGTHTGEL